MPDTLEAPQPTKRKRPIPPKAWTKEQAHAAYLKSRESFRRNQAARKALAEQHALMTQTISEPDPVAELELRIVRETRRGAKPSQVDKLAQALARLQGRQGKGRRQAQPPSRPQYTTGSVAPSESLHHSHNSLSLQDNELNITNLVDIADNVSASPPGPQVTGKESTFSQGVA
jgi:hypothetical protein